MLVELGKVLCAALCSMQGHVALGKAYACSALQGHMPVALRKALSAVLWYTQGHMIVTLGKAMCLQHLTRPYDCGILQSSVLCSMHGGRKLVAFVKAKRLQRFGHMPVVLC